MNTNNLEFFAQNYPKDSGSRSPSTERALPQISRTPLRDVVEEGYHVKRVLSPKQSMSESSKQGTKKFLAILLITFVGALIYSALAYTVTDSLFGKMGIEFFSETGQPGPAIIAIHSLVFLSLTYLIINTIRWC